GQKVLTIVQCQLLSIPNQRVLYLVPVCCGGDVHISRDDSDPVNGTVGLEHLKVFATDVGMDVGWYKPKHIGAGRLQHRIVVECHERNWLATLDAPISDTVEEVAVIGYPSRFGRPELRTDPNHIPQVVSDGVQLHVPLFVVLAFGAQRFQDLFEVRVLGQLPQPRNDGTTLPVLLHGWFEWA